MVAGQYGNVEDALTMLRRVCAWSCRVGSKATGRITPGGRLNSYYTPLSCLRMHQTSLLLALKKLSSLRRLEAFALP